MPDSAPYNDARILALLDGLLTRIDSLEQEVLALVEQDRELKRMLVLLYEQNIKLAKENDRKQTSNNGS